MTHLYYICYINLIYVKKILVALAGACLLAVGCKEDFEIAAPYKTVTAVWGLLNMADTAHYIKVNKAFLDGSKNAFDMAKVVDSSTIEGVEVYIQEINNSGTILEEIQLEKVDLIQEGYVKEEGIFAHTPNYAYKFKKTLSSDHLYKLRIVHPNGRVDSAETRVIDTNYHVVRLSTPGALYNFSRTLPTSKVSFTAPWPKNAYIGEASLNFKYRDYHIASNQSELKSVLYNLGERVVKEGNNSMTFDVYNLNVYAFLASNIRANDGTLERYMGGVDFTFYAAGQSLYNYIIVSAVQSSGLTSDQIQTKYTNIEGEDVVGIFDSRMIKRYNNIKIDPNTIDSMMRHPLTQPINIAGQD
jgi:hypothetical protein